MRQRGQRQPRRQRQLRERRLIALEGRRADAWRPAGYTAAFAWGDEALAFRSSDPWASRIADAAFGSLAAAPRECTHRANVYRDASGMLHASFDNTRFTFSIADLGDFSAAFRAVRELFARFAVAASGGMAFYGACVALPDAAAAIVGPTTIGKTLLALHTAYLGARFCADETFCIAPHDGTQRAFPRRPALREPALRFLPDARLTGSIERARHVAHLPGGRLWYALEKHDLAGIEADPVPRQLRMIVVAEQRGSRPILTPLSREDLVEALLRRAYRRPSPLQQAILARKTLPDVRGYSLCIGAPHETAVLLYEALSACG